jgi:RNA methyltransferase, rsmE family
MSTKMKDLPLFYAPALREELQLPEGEAQHAIRVLRAKVGDEFLVTDGCGTLFETRVSGVDRRHCLLSIEREEPWQKYWRGHWAVAVAPTKNIDRLEWTLEKMVEVGLDEVYLIRTQHSERKHTSTERLERIIQSAMKQSHKALLPRLIPDVPFAQLLEMTADYDLRLMAHCRSTVGPERHTIDHFFRPEAKTLLMVGPEGDFSVEEIEEATRRGCQPITLGASRLRTETASLIALQWLHTLDMTSQRRPTTHEK